VTVLVVALVSYGLARLLSRPIRTLRVSMREIAKGNLDCRISEKRKDELGLVFAEFNRMAESLEGDNEPFGPAPEA
jgi:methyl-accepting chemotaxis protein